MKLLLLLLSLTLLVGCSDFKNQAQQNSEKTDFRYGNLYRVKEGFYRNYGCIAIANYENSIFCRVYSVIEDGKSTRLKEEYQTRENFEKSNLEHVDYVND